MLCPQLCTQSLSSNLCSQSIDSSRASASTEAVEEYIRRSRQAILQAGASAMSGSALASTMHFPSLDCGNDVRCLFSQ